MLHPSNPSVSVLCVMEKKTKEGKVSGGEFSKCWLIKNVEEHQYSVHMQHMCELNTILIDE